jgi:hypothetical protein
MPPSDDNDRESTVKTDNIRFKKGKKTTAKTRRRVMRKDKKTKKKTS